MATIAISADSLASIGGQTGIHVMEAVTSRRSLDGTTRRGGNLSFRVQEVTRTRSSCSALLSLCFLGKKIEKDVNFSKKRRVG